MLQPAVTPALPPPTTTQQPEKVLAVLRRGDKKTTYTKSTKTVRHGNGFETITTR